MTSIDPGLPFTDPCLAFIKTWIDRYGVDPVLPRTVLSDAIEHNFWSSITPVIPELISSPGPNTLVRWLILYENVALYDATGERYRFSRVGHRWVLLKFPPPPHQSLEENISA